MGFLEFLIAHINIYICLFCSSTWYPFYFFVNLHKFGTTRIAVLIDTILEHEETLKRSISDTGKCLVQLRQFARCEWNVSVRITVFITFLMLNLPT